MMSKFKIGDWVLYHHPEDEGVQLAEIKTNEQLSQADDDDSIELWQPKEGEWCVMEGSADDNSFTVQKWSSRGGWKAQPFMGMLPNFIKAE